MDIIKQPPDKSKQLRTFSHGKIEPTPGEIAILIRAAKIDATMAYVFHDGEGLWNVAFEVADFLLDAQERS